MLPAEIIFRHPGFRRPYHNVPPAGGKLLHTYAADLARAADGRWWVLADRSEAPSGVGFSLENRVVISRMLPTIFRDANVQRLAPYFITLQEIAPATRPAPSRQPADRPAKSGADQPELF